MMQFNQKVLCIGFGSVGRCTLPVLLEHIRIPYKNITVLDFADKRKELALWIKKGVRYAQERISPVNVARTLSKYVSSGGMIIDLSWNIDSLDMLSWCHDNKVFYINTSVEEWDPYANIERKTPFEKSLYFKQMKIREMTAKWADGHTTAVLDHGANPGLISHFTKQGLLDIAEKSVHDKTTLKKDRKILEHLIRGEDFAALAMKLGVKTIHVSERDTQITDQPKEVDEFVGTWSIEGLREEGVAPSEMGWGTHEKELPPFAAVPEFGPKNQIFLSQMGMNTWIRSWVPNYEIVGMAIRHAEAFSISEKLTVWRNSKAVYRPTVHYVYMPCNETLSSLHELRCRNYELQPRCRIMSDEIIRGKDILGALLMGHKYTSWWTGSVLDIEEARKLVPHQNATTIQVAIGVVAAAMWMIKNPQNGVCLPDDLPHKEVLSVAKPYLGQFVSEPYSWTPFKNYQVFFPENPNSNLDKKNPWSFRNFLFKD
ncbi:MAG TPA: saccharopine dehydrogenase C-terminal domain-containing protein [Candidatus Omnitrophota bacterium]|nr:saccharopine dehydrogenase C-terminal domain-containing protein [Candidatus Omnitrophota bacterium]